MPSTEEMLRVCRLRGAAGTFMITRRAQDAALAQGHSSADVRHALSSASSCQAEGEHWKVDGPSLDGNEVTMLVTVSGGDLVVL